LGADRRRPRRNAGSEHDVPHGDTQQSGMSISPGSSHATVGDMEHWMGGGFDTPLLPSFASHYVTGDGAMPGRRSTLRYLRGRCLDPVEFPDLVRLEVK
jgi:hypothetical protein